MVKLFGTFFIIGIFISMGRPYKTRTRFIGKDGLWYYDCIKCEMFFPEHRMSVNIAYKFGVDKYCRLCKQQANESYDRKTLPQKSYDRNGELKNRWEMSVARTFGTRFMTYSDYEDAMNYLNLIGYNTKGDIHQQFCDRIKEKHGVVLEQTDIKHTDTDPYPFKSPYNEDKL